MFEYLFLGKIYFFLIVLFTFLGFEGFFTLTVRATELSRVRGNRRGDFTEITFNITINDLNDELPKFERPYYQLSLTENTAVGSPLPISIPVSGE